MHDPSDQWVNTFVRCLDRGKEVNVSFNPGQYAVLKGQVVGSCERVMLLFTSEMGGNPYCDAMTKGKG